ncbi:Osmotically-inducible protein OsmY, contains BON domain [Nitrosospira multiformis]|uniref:Osmotically-inducible protein OsmY, contains BON domain n=1 Tax=Nitrosospira multiformis TaxID=1231 RepID=A0A1H9ZY87_9PROT|nr:BON domain-containing protein [Nitrosospira multiformis]SES86322.1 Osmotically-inducible protein OsmY, contains BON domain [Nitrosospira multiformis]
MQYLDLKSLLLVFFLLPFLSACGLIAAGGMAAGVGTGVAMSQDRRTSGMFVEDESIEFRSGQRISEKFSSDVHVNITSFNRNVLLTGEAPSETIKEEIGNLVSNVENVRDVTNEITVGSPSSFTSRGNDTLITSLVKGHFMDSGRFQANHVKVVTEDGIVYLLGLVRGEEAENAEDLAKRVDGVKKVVKVFEYME